MSIESKRLLAYNCLKMVSKRISWGRTIFRALKYLAAVLITFATLIFRRALVFLQAPPFPSTTIPSSFITLAASNSFHAFLARFSAWSRMAKQGLFLRDIASENGTHGNTTKMRRTENEEKPYVWPSWPLRKTKHVSRKDLKMLFFLSIKQGYEEKLRFLNRTH